MDKASPVFPFLANLGPQKAALLLVGLSFVLHWITAASFSLSQDEAHYALYGVFLDWSYFDHPPLVGWLQYLALQLGDSDVVLRLWAMLGSALLSLGLYLLGRQLYPHNPWIALIAIALYHSSLMFHLLGLAVIPETPLLLCFVFAALFSYQAVVEKRDVAWIGLGLCVGFAGLAKYTAITLALSLIVFIVLERAWFVFKRPMLWLGLLLAALLVSPVLVWNANHEWASFVYQINHGAPDTTWELQRVAISQVAQLVVYGPLLFIGGLLVIWPMAKAWHLSAHRLLLAFVIPVLLLFAYTGGYDETLPHWTAVVWLLLTLPVAKFILEGCLQAWFVKLGVGFSVILLAVFFSLAWWNWLPHKENNAPLAELTAWQEAGEWSKTWAAEHPEQKVFIGNWSVASQLAWYAHPQPVFTTKQRVDDQLKRWFGAPEAGDDGLLVVPPKYINKAKANGLQAFESCYLLHEMKVGSPPPAAIYRFYQCHAYQPADV